MMKRRLVTRLREPIVIGTANWQRILEERAEAAFAIERTSAIALKYMKLCKEHGIALDAPASPVPPSNDVRVN